MINNLAGKKILITRPVNQSHNICEKILALQGVPVLFPTIEISDPPDVVAMNASLKKLPEQELVIFISPSSVEKSLPPIFDLFKTWPANLKIAAIGVATARALAAAGLEVDIYPADKFNSENLLALPLLQDVRQKKIMLLRGLGGREILADVLRKRGAHLTEVITYQRCKPDVDMSRILRDWQQKKIDIIVCTSNTGLQNLFDMVGENGREWLQNMALLATSERMVKLAAELGFKKIPWLAKNPSDESVIEALLFWRNKIKD